MQLLFSPSLTWPSWWRAVQVNSAESHPIKHTPGHCRTFANPCPARDSPGRTYAIRVVQRTGAKTTHLSGGETNDPREDIRGKKRQTKIAYLFQKCPGTL
jgi:hypothetical protein